LSWWIPILLYSLIVIEQTSLYKQNHKSPLNYCNLCTPYESIFTFEIERAILHPQRPILHPLKPQKKIASPTAYITVM
jgi:hypothetical protein